MIVSGMPVSKRKKERSAEPSAEQDTSNRKKVDTKGQSKSSLKRKTKRTPKSRKEWAKSSVPVKKNEAISQSAIENQRATQLVNGRSVDSDLTNAELRRLLDRALVRFGNWKVQMESNPSPKMVHSLKSIVSIIETITSISEQNIRYSYKDLSLQMSSLIEGVAQLNLLITGSLLEDDSIDEVEETLINNQMMTVIQRTVELIRLVQQSFGLRNRLVESTEEPKP